MSHAICGKRQLGIWRPEVPGFGSKSQTSGIQRDLAEKENVVMDGRDIGTSVLPDADLKIFLTASVDTRARRRYNELLEKGESCDYEKIASDIEERDRRDMTRDISPLCQAEDARLD